jgi:hypothetical protein
VLLSMAGRCHGVVLLCLTGIQEVQALAVGSQRVVDSSSRKRVLDALLLLRFCSGSFVAQAHAHPLFSPAVFPQLRPSIHPPSSPKPSDPGSPQRTHAGPRLCSPERCLPARVPGSITWSFARRSADWYRGDAYLWFLNGGVRLFFLSGSG